MRATFLFPAISAALLTACGSQDGTDANVSANGAVTPAETGAPEGNEELVTTGLYPGSRAGGAKDIYVTNDPIDRVIAWYREDAARRSQGLSFSSERRDDGYFIVGNDLNQLKSFLIHLVPRDGGGTELRLYPFDYLAKGGKLEDRPSN